MPINFVAQIGHRELLQLALVSFCRSLIVACICVCVFSTSLLSGVTRCSRLTCVFPTPVPESTISQGAVLSFTEEC